MGVAQQGRETFPSHLMRQKRQILHTQSQPLRRMPHRDGIGSSAVIPPSAHIDVPPASILVIDDDSAIQTLVQFCLQLAGHHVVCVTGRVPVLTLLSSGHFDLVITDMLMPDINGTEVIAATRIHQPDAAILAMSGDGTHLPADDELNLAGSSGVAAPLLKPFHLGELMDAVKQALQSRGRRAPAYVADGLAVLN
jgi:DNA-binding NtrC family response regulator